uniref:Zinc finger Ran-binding domain-containing protein 2 n=1 Tax=Cacopsylla melanoneura TaxID=428564 RepID=A0A8D8WEH5_9HEMI
MIIKEDKTSKLRLEDWVCVDPLCGNVNYHWRKVCNKCKTNRDEHIPPMVKVIGRNAAEQSEGIFKAQDWQCKACGNVNWARRQACNRCHTSKFDLVNMLNQDELEDDDNMSVHSALSALAFPCDNDSGISSGSEIQDKKNGRLMLSRVIQWTTKLVSRFTEVSKEDILAGVVPSDKETINDTLLAIILGGIATGKVPDSKSNELDNLSKEDRIKLLISKCDIPEEAKKMLPHLSLAEFKKNFLQRVTGVLLSRQSTISNGVPASILTPPVTPEQQPSQDETRRIIMVSEPNPASHHRPSGERVNNYNGINPASHPQNQRRSPSPYNNRRSRSPYNQRHSPAPYDHRRSRSPRNMRHSPGQYNDRRSPSPHHNRRSQSPHHYRRSISPYNRHSPSRNGRHSPPHHNSRRHSPPPSRHYDGRQYPGPRHYEIRERGERRPAPYRRYSPERCASRHRPGFR